MFDPSVGTRSAIAQSKRVAARTGAKDRRGSLRSSSPAKGFTLLEICIVLVILAILMAVISPGIQSALAEQTLRSDASRLSLMVKTAMLRTAEEHRPYSLDLTDTSLALAPLPGNKTAVTVSTPTTMAGSDTEAGADTVTENWRLNEQNKLLLPDPKATGNWLPLKSAQWIFRPGELCPATAVCFTRGEARLQMSFNALTGNVEDETSFFP